MHGVSEDTGTIRRCECQVQLITQALADERERFEDALRLDPPGAQSQPIDGQVSPLYLQIFPLQAVGE